MHKHSRSANRAGGLSSTSVTVPTKQKSQMISSGKPKGHGMNKQELQKVAMLVKSDKFTPLREPSPVTSARLSKFNEVKSADSKSCKSVGGRAQRQKPKKEM